MAKGGLHPGAPGDQPILRLQLESGETQADKERLEREHREGYRRHLASFSHGGFGHLDPALPLKIEWVD